MSACLPGSDAPVSCRKPEGGRTVDGGRRQGLFGSHRAICVQAIVIIISGIEKLMHDPG